MEINSEQHFDPESKALYEEGIDVGFGGETLTFSEGGRTLVYTIDELTPSYAVLRDTFVNGARLAPRISPCSPGSGAVQVSKSDALFMETVRFLHVERSIECISVYDGPSGGYRQVSVNHFL
jgi:hypothetical protein